jgi:hypothetical protein
MISNFQLLFCCCFCCIGVDFADAFSEHLELLTNGTEVPNRRDKYIQQEMIRQAGLRAVRQVSNKYSISISLDQSID